MIEQVRNIDEFKQIVDSRFRTHYMLEYRNDLQQGRMMLIFKLQGFSRPYYIDDQAQAHIVEYTEVISVSWNDKEVMELLEENPGMRTTDAMVKVLEEKGREFIKIAEVFNATEGQYIL